MRKELLFLIGCCHLLLTGCRHKREYFPHRLQPLDVHIERFDNALMQVSDTTALEDIRSLYDSFPDFMPVFVEQVLGIPARDTACLAEQLPRFLTDTMYGFAATNRLEQELFADITPIEKQLGEALARMQYLFPEWDTPKIWLFVSGFNASVLFLQEGIAVGADMYLGSDYPYYNRVVYDYQKRTMRPECMAADVVSAWLFRHVTFSGKQNRLLEQMLYRGRVMYLLSVLFREEQPWDVMGYSREQWQWCVKYERATWNRIIERRDLFSSEQRKIASYLNDGPFTSEISQKSPGRLGTWVGWRIVESYMEHHKEVTMRQLMEESDAQKILEESYYKP